MSDRPEGRPVPSLARASARNARTRTAGRTDGTNTQRSNARQPMSDQECKTIRQAGADDARRSRLEHGFPERIEDPATIAVLAGILRDARAPPGQSRDNARNQLHNTKAAEAITATRLRRLPFEYRGFHGDPLRAFLPACQCHYCATMLV